MNKEKYSFQAEVGKILDVVAHSLYSQSEIFVREYISNAADACDKLRYESIKNTKLQVKDNVFKIEIELNPKNKIITIKDNGIGMNKEDLISSLGTIAKSGTEAFIEKLKSEKNNKNNMALIGQFGVGFYSGFMVAENIKVISKKAGESNAWIWESDGKGNYTIDKASRDTNGTDVIIFLSEKAKEFTETLRIENIIKKYSDHISIPVYLLNTDDKDKKSTLTNKATAIWSRDKKEIKTEQYKEFYNNITFSFDEPWLTIHNKIEGIINYTNLLFIPGARPPDIFTPDRKSNLKLYVKKVFITESCDELIPRYLRFVKGIIDSDDISLNISREMLQHDPLILKINKSLTKRILSELSKKCEKSRTEFLLFWKNFGMLLKEGIHEDYSNKQKILDFSLFNTSTNEDMTTLDEYKNRIKEGQENIFYLSGEDKEQLKNSPQLETFKSNEIEVLIMDDPVDEFWLSTTPEYKDLKFKSITKGDIDISKIKLEKTPSNKKTKDKINNKDLESLITYLKNCFGNEVKDVRISKRLTESPICLVADETEMDMHLESLLKKHKQLDKTSTKILEIKDNHDLIASLTKIDRSKKENRDKLETIAFLLLDQAKIIEGIPINDSRRFSNRINKIAEESIK